jgi:hypothetical protein
MKTIIKGLLLVLVTSLLHAEEVPQSPSNLILEAKSQKEVLIQWQDNSDNETGFKIYREGILIAITKPNDISYVDTELTANTTYTYTVKATNDTINTFATIRTLIGQADAGVTDVTYICVGDDTRAGDLSPFDDPKSPYAGGHLFDRLLDVLSGYGVDAHLYARNGHEAKQFNDIADNSPTWQDVLSIIPDDGNTTIVDISLGINDLLHVENGSKTTIEDIKINLKEAIEKMKNEKPNTHFMLTMPPRKYDPSNIKESDDEATILSNVYKQLAAQMNIPLVNTMGELMPSHSSLQSSWYQDDEVHYHLTEKGQQLLADLILSKIMP